MKIDIVFPEFFTWTWNYSYGMVKALDELGYRNKVIDISNCSEKRILGLEKTQADMILFMGGCEHSPRLYDSKKKTEMLERINLPKVSIIVESFEYDKLDKVQFPTIQRHLIESKQNSGFFTHLITSDERDVDVIKREFNPSIRSCWMPQCVDETIFISQRKVKEFKNSFIGSLYLKRAYTVREFTNNNIYVNTLTTNKPNVNSRKFFKKLRKKIKKTNLPIFADSLISKINMHFSHSSKKKSTEDLVNTINKTELNFNLPGPHKGFTSRVFEVLSCKGVLIQPFPHNRKLTSSLFEDMHNICYYDPNNIHESVDKINKLLTDKNKLVEIGSNARAEIIKLHTCKQRILDIVSFVNNTYNN